MPAKGGHGQFSSERSPFNPGSEDLVGISVVEDSKLFLDPLEATDGIELKEKEAPWQRALDGEELETTTIPPKVLGYKRKGAHCMCFSRSSRLDSA
jgi:hypothetical protein